MAERHRTISKVARTGPDVWPLQPMALDAQTCFEMLEHGMIDEAEESVAALLKQNPSDAEAHNVYIECAILRRNLVEAQKRITAALEINMKPKFRKAIDRQLSYIRREEANNLIRTANLTEARQILNQVLRNDPSDPQALMLMGKTFTIENKPAEAIPWFEASFEAKPHVVSAVALGMATEKTGRVGVAEQWYAAGVKLDPKNERALSGLARLESARGAFTSSLEHLRTALEAQPSNQTIIYTYTHALIKTNKIAEAREFLEPYRQLHRGKDPQNTFFKTLLTYVCIAEKNYVEARKLLEEIRVLQPDNRTIPIEIAQTYIEEGNAPAAQKILEAEYKNDSKRVRTIVRLGETHLLQKNYQKAEKFFSEALGLENDNRFARYFLAKTLFLNNESIRGQNILAPLLQTEPINAGALYLYACFVPDTHNAFWETMAEVVPPDILSRARLFRNSPGLLDEEEKKSYFYQNSLWDEEGPYRKPINQAAAYDVGLNRSENLH